MSSIIGGLVLAAGAGQRFGSDKRVARLADGRTLLEHSLDTLREAVDELVLVIGAQDAADFAAQFPGVRVLRAPRSSAGMGSTLADAVAQCRHWDGCLVALGDKPFLRGTSARRVRELLATHTLVVPRFAGEQGHPAGFAGQHFRALAGLAGERGARALIEVERERCLFVDLDDPGVVADVDTPEQLVWWQERLGA